MSNTTVIAVIAAAGLVFALVRRLSSRGKELLYPPGPKPLPLLGNIRDIPLVSPWFTYTEWRKKYGQFRAYLILLLLISILISDRRYYVR